MNRKIVKQVISIFLFATGLGFCFTLFRRFRFGINIPILMYHSVSDDSQCQSVTRANFRKQMKYLASEYEVIPLKKIPEILLGGQKPKEKLAVITFDDGYKDNYDFAFPILREFQLPATIFVATNYIGRDDFNLKYGFPPKEMLSWNEIKEMSRNNNVDIGSHTMSHQILSKLSLPEAKEEVGQSKRTLEAHIRQPVQTLSYPNGQITDFTSDIEYLVKELGYSCACSTIWGTFQTSANLFALHRIRVDGNDTLFDFKWKLKGCYDWIGLLHLLKVFKPFSIFGSTQ